MTNKASGFLPLRDIYNMEKLIKALIPVVILISIHGAVAGYEHEAASFNDTSEERTPLAKNYDKQCLNSLAEIVRELSSTIPPEGKTTSNYRNISRALFPALKLPSLYVKITLLFLKDDRVNQTVLNEEKFTWMESCGFVTDIPLEIMSVFSLYTVWPQRRQSELHLTVHPLCNPASFVEENSFKDEQEMWSYLLLTLQDMVIRPNVSDPRVNTAHCVVKGHEGDKHQPIEMKSLSWHNYRGYFVFSLSLMLSLVTSWYAMNWLSYPNKERKHSTYLCMVPYCLILLVIELIATCCLLAELCKMDSFQVNVQYHCIINVCLHYFSCLCMLIVNCTWRPKNEVHKTLSYLVYPCVYQIYHHFFWVLCEGIPSDPSWAVPIFLSECLAVLALVIANHLSFGVTLKPCIHIYASAFASLFGLFTVGISFYNSSIGELTGNVLTLGLAGVLYWLIKKSGLYKDLLQGLCSG